MHVRRVIVAGLCAFGLAGCAGQSAFEEIKRLKADVGLLDQRVTQLERVSVQGAPASTWPTEPQRPSAPTASAAVNPSAAPTTKPAVARSGQPSKREVQQALKNAGVYQGPVDGKLGPQTREAIKQFQRANGLKVDGTIGRHTWQKLAPYLNVTAAGEQPATAQPSK